MAYVPKKIVVPGTISVRAYAKTKSVTDSQIYHLIKTGKIINGAVKTPDGITRINPVVANIEWAANFGTASTKVETAAKVFAAAATPAVKATGKTKEPPAPAEMPQEVLSAIGIMANINKAKLSQAVTRAKMMDLELKEAQGKVVDKEKVYAALFAAGQELRQELQALPDRHIDSILAAPSRNDAYEILANAIADVLENLAGIETRDVA